LCAALRLAKYNAMDADSHPDYFVGMPSTLSGAFNALLLIIFYKHGLFVEGNPYVYIPAVMLITTALLMVSPLFLAKLKMRKSKFINFVQIISVATGYVFGFAMIFEEYLISLITIYSVVGFGYGILNRDQILNHDKVPQA
jgi:CDP-diacylglycerol--serine O-phosphatidyltransferase